MSFGIVPSSFREGLGFQGSIGACIIRIGFEGHIVLSTSYRGLNDRNRAPLKGSIRVTTYKGYSQDLVLGPL